jgi:hypothetical protein
MISIFAVLDEFPDYLIGRDSTVISFKNGGRAEMQGGISNSGYQFVRLVHITGKVCTVYRHFLVLKCFGPPQPPGTQVNHKDGDKFNNSPENLEWVTPVENAQHYQMVLRPKRRRVA